MTSTLIRTNAELAPRAETLTSGELYARIMAHAERLNVMTEMTADEADWRNTFYNEMNVQRTHLDKAPEHPNGHGLYIKYEGHQPGGRSFKARGGAYSVMVAQANAGPVPLKEIHIASAGNAAQGVEAAATKYGLKTVAHVTPMASKVKVASLLQNGVEVVTGTTVGIDDSGNEVMKSYADLDEARNGARNVTGDGIVTLEAYDQVEVIAGQATVGYEAIQDLLDAAGRGELDLKNDPVKIYVPVGGGGLIAGVACVVRSAKDAGLLGENVQVVGVQMEGCDAARRALPYLRRGQEPPHDLFTNGVIFNGKTDGAAVPRAGRLPLTIMADRRFVAGIESVTEIEVAEAMLWSRDVYGAVAEPTAALSLAASRKRAASVPTEHGQRAVEHHVALVTGSNIDPETFKEFSEKALAARKKAAEMQKYAVTKATSLAAYNRELLRLGGVIVDDKLVRPSALPQNMERTPAAAVQGTNVWSSLLAR